MKTPVSDESPDDDNSSSHSGSSGGDSSHTNETPVVNGEPEKVAPRLASKETWQVNMGKCLVIVVLILSAAATSTVIYLTTKESENASFEAAFKNLGEMLLHNAGQVVADTGALMEMISASITSHAVSSNLTFPFVTFPDFEIRIIEARKLTGSALIGVSLRVSKEQRHDWVSHSLDNQGWIQQSIDFQAGQKVQGEPVPLDDMPSSMILPYITGQNRSSLHEKDEYIVGSQIGPVTAASSLLINMDWSEMPLYTKILNDIRRINQPVLSQVIDVKDFLIEEDTVKPFSFVVDPIFDSLTGGSAVVGYTNFILVWDSFFANVLPLGTGRILAEVTDTCGSRFTYAIDGRNTSFLGHELLHDPEYERLALRTKTFGQFRHGSHSRQGYEGKNVSCAYTISVFPTDDFAANYESNEPVIFAVAVLLVFFFTTMVFVLYDVLVARRQKKVLITAERTTAIVASLFPKNVQQRLMEEAQQQAEAEATTDGGFSPFVSSKTELKKILGAGDKKGKGADSSTQRGKPLADLFTDTTVMFADIVGFTAWSSTREPSQVFTLLETIYHGFDEIANLRRVYKVETIGDCYVAVCGLPDPRKDHAVVMARFASDCLDRFLTDCRKLDCELGPDTSELGLRIGMHSGAVTAGVLRGERARFQLFGDCMNTAARMESTGARNRIHVSAATADLLTAKNKTNWLQPREDKVFAKGKGEMQTYWVTLKSDASRSESSACSRNTEQKAALARTHADALAVELMSSNKIQRLVEWNTESLSTSLKAVIARRQACCVVSQSEAELLQLEHDLSKREGIIVLDEFKESIHLPNYSQMKNQVDISNIDLSEKVASQLRSYVQCLSSLYRDNPFHSFEHASHVSMSVLKLMSRIIAPDIECRDGGDADSTLHDHTYGITSDPLTRFAVHLSALIHDVDHNGVPNAQLVKENAAVAGAYGNRSVAEQNSVDIAWKLLMQDDYADLRRAIYVNESEFRRFRQLIVNTVMATDIMDRDLKTMRNFRWNKAFSESTRTTTSADVDRDLKATIVIEHLIQASDVAHTMQHWYVYLKWNKRFFVECYKAYKEGRAETDPSVGWYKGEIGFFDFYIIPLAKKLKDCGVFGVSSDEYLAYAEQNRLEWEQKGQKIVAELLEYVNCEYPDLA